MAAPSVPTNVDLEWQSFPTTAGAPPPPEAGSAAAGSAPATVPGAVAPTLSPLGLFSVSFYKQLFDVDTDAVLQRLRLSLNPLAETPFLSTGIPDLYGPVWISATLVFVIGACSNFASWYASSGAHIDEVWKYDFRLITQAMFTVAGFCAGGAMLAWGAASYLGVSSVSMLQVLCVYGYSLTAFIPAALLCIIPAEAVQWISVVFAIVISGLFLIKALWPAVREQVPAPQGRALIFALFGAHVMFGLVLKLYFFSFAATALKG